MRHVVGCREFELVPVGSRDGLSEAELDYLTRLRAGGPAFFGEERRNGRWHCRFAGFVGAIALPGGRSLEIRPKLEGTSPEAERALVMRMLAATGLAPAVEHDVDVYARSPDLIEAYLGIAADLAQRRLRQGLVHTYRCIDLRAPYVRGRLRVAEQMARLQERIDQHLLRADLFTADTPVNRAIKVGIRRIERLSRVGATRGRCLELLARLDAVGDHPSGLGASAAFRDLVVDRRHAHLATLVELLRLIVDDQGSAAAAGADAPGPAWLFAMDRLFEMYVVERLRRVATGVEIAAQGPRRDFIVGGRHPMCPDIVLLRGGRPAAVLDAKWKRLDRRLDDVDEADLRQIYAYARIYDVSCAALLYPGAKAPDALRADLVVNDGTGLRLSIRQLPLLETTSQALDHMLTRLLDELGVLAVPRRPQ